MKLLGAAVALVVTVQLTPSVLAAPPPGALNCPVFPTNNIWNADISQLPVHPRSVDWLASSRASTKLLHPDFGRAAYGFPWIVVDNSHPRVSVAFDYSDESDPGPYPFDVATPIEGGQDATGDRHALMINRDSCTLYELYAAYWNSGAPTAGSGAIFDLNGNALRPSTWTSADAAGLPILPGLVRYDEVQAGAITHAIRFTVRRTDKSFLWPARHQAGAQHDPTLPPMGARFRLKPSFDASSYSPAARVVVAAMQRFGLIVADNGSDWFFQGTQDDRWSDDLLTS